MATYYVDPAAGGANNGTSWADAWTSAQSAFDNVAAGDIVYCRGTQTLAAAIDVDTTDGATNNPIQFIGTNASGVEDGTYFTLDGNSAAANCLYVDNIDGYIIKNFRCTNATGDGVQYNVGPLNWIWYNCRFDNNGGHGFDTLNNGNNSIIARCKFDSNTSDGLVPINSSPVIFSEFINNGGKGAATRYSAMIGCVFHNNTGVGLEVKTERSTVIHCVFDGNGGDNLDLGGNSAISIYGCRFTNGSAWGIDTSQIGVQIEDFNFFFNNTSGTINTPTRITVRPGNTELAGSADGYADRAADDFSLADTAELRRGALTVGSDS